MKVSDNKCIKDVKKPTFAENNSEALTRDWSEVEVRTCSYQDIELKSNPGDWLWM